jgi:hypothetical protein
MSAYQVDGAAPEALHLGFAAVPSGEIEAKVWHLHAAVAACF